MSQSTQILLNKKKKTPSRLALLRKQERQQLEKRLQKLRSKPQLKLSFNVEQEYNSALKQLKTQFYVDQKREKDNFQLPKLNLNKTSSIKQNESQEEEKHKKDLQIPGSIESKQSSSGKSPQKQSLWRFRNSSLKILPVEQFIQKMLETSSTKRVSTQDFQQTFITEHKPSKNQYTPSKYCYTTEESTLADTQRIRTKRLVFPPETTRHQVDTYRDKLNDLIQCCNEFNQEGKSHIKTIDLMSNLHKGLFSQIDFVLNDIQASISDQIFGPRYIKQAIQEFKKENLGFVYGRGVGLFLKRIV